jgi:hypothetical protein
MEELHVLRKSGWPWKLCYILVVSKFEHSYISNVLGESDVERFSLKGVKEV